MRKKTRKIETLILVLLFVIAGVAMVTRRTASAPGKVNEHPMLARSMGALSSTTITFTQTNLVSDLPGLATTTDPNLVNPWGITLGLGLNNGLWVSDNGSGNATTYDATGQPIPLGAPLVVTVPAPGGAGPSKPTGVATNGTSGFVISSGGNSGPSAELFSTEDGTIAGWNSSVDANHAVIAVDNSASEAIYKGLAIGFNASGAFLFATNFHAGTVDVFDANFQPVNIPNGFRDHKIPSGFAPFGISAINGNLYVTYAKQDEDKEDDVPGPGDGFLNIFDTHGRLLERFISRGELNAPWGMAWVPFEGFGEFNNALLVGNFGDGTVNAFDFDTGEFLGKVNDASGTPIVISGLWGLQFGLTFQGRLNTLYFTAGIEDEEHGLLGTLTVNPASLPPPEEPMMTDPNLTVNTEISGLNQPTSMAFLGPHDFLILEKATGKVQHVLNGVVIGTALDLAVNSASERGLLGIALQPNFAATNGVYLYWTQSSTGADSANLADVPLLGNRVDRYIWNPATQTLAFDKNIIMLRSFHADAGQPLRGHHDAGKILFGSDGMLYFMIGDQGRRGQLQNLASGPFGPGQPDDQFGGPAPDNAHFTGVIFRLNADGSTPFDNPFANVTAEQVALLEQQAGVTLTASQLAEVVANIHKIYSYGHRNSFGLAVDPVTGFLWESENGDDSFDEINRVTAGSNGGWIQIMGPRNRVAQFKEIETIFTPMQGNIDNGRVPLNPLDLATFIPALQQLRFPPSLLPDTTEEALSRLFVLPGSKYTDPEFSWKWAVAPAAIGFAGNGVGAQHTGSLFVGASRTFLEGGYLFEFTFDQSRKHFAFSEAGAKDKVADNEYKFDEDGSESLMAGENFGIVTDIMTGPDGNLYVTSLSKGTVYMISNPNVANRTSKVTKIRGRMTTDAAISVMKLGVGDDFGSSRRLSADVKRWPQN